MFIMKMCLKMWRRNKKRQCVICSTVADLCLLTTYSMFHVQWETTLEILLLFVLLPCLFHVNPFLQFVTKWEKMQILRTRGWRQGKIIFILDEQSIIAMLKEHCKLPSTKCVACHFFNACKSILLRDFQHFGLM